MPTPKQTPCTLRKEKTALYQPMRYLTLRRQSWTDCSDQTMRPRREKHDRVIRYHSVLRVEEVKTNA
jgi:hypothetical protein